LVIQLTLVLQLGQEKASSHHHHPFHHLHPLLSIWLFDAFQQVFFALIQRHSYNRIQLLPLLSEKDALPLHLHHPSRPYSHFF
jgi:hypothetical protein